jgi:hypothetical protein
MAEQSFFGEKAERAGADAWNAARGAASSPSGSRQNRVSSSKNRGRISLDEPLKQEAA